MVMQFDPAVGRVMAQLAEAVEGQAQPAVGDSLTRRQTTDGFLAQLFAVHHGDVTVADHRVPVEGGEMELRQFTASGANPTAAVLWIHGGGMICGSVELYDPLLRRYAAQVPEVTVLSPDYRLAPEHPHPTPVQDCYAGLTWLVEHAADLGIDPDRIAVAGDSAGGGLAAGVALLARDRSGPAIARQLLVYPMLDDCTTTPDPEIEGMVMWSYDDNKTGWGALLGDGAGDVSPYAAPARAADLARLPRTYIDVGELDIFRDEDLTYGMRLAQAGVSIEVHVIPGAVHAFEHLAPEAEISRRAFDDRARFMRALAD